MRVFLQLVLVVVVITFGCQAWSEEEDSSSEEKHMESEEANQSQERSDHSEKVLHNIRGNKYELTSFSTKKSKNYDLEIEIAELREFLRDQSRWNNRLEQKVGELKETQKNQNKWFKNTESGLKELKETLEQQSNNKQLKAAQIKLKEINDNQNDLKNTFRNQNSSNYKEIKQMAQNQNRLLQNFANGRRNMTVLGKSIELLMEPNGWIVIQSRFNGSVDFYRNWTDYRNGFGSLDGEFWLGFENIYALTSTKQYELLVQLEDYYGVMKFAQYKKFLIGAEDTAYMLKSLGRFSGTAGDSLYFHQGMKFTTYDRDNDQRKNGNCAKDMHGAWWYKDCHISNLNGLYQQKTGTNYMSWHTFNKAHESLKSSKMMIKEV